MKYLILSILLALSFAGCTHEPKFAYGDCVKVTGGFFRGCYGVIADYDPEWVGFRLWYTQCTREEIGMKWIAEKDLSLMDAICVYTPKEKK